MTGRDGTYVTEDVVDDDSQHLIRNAGPDFVGCGAELADAGSPWRCTREASHAGQHEAAGLGIICAVWS